MLGTKQSISLMVDMAQQQHRLTPSLLFESTPVQSHCGTPDPLQATPIPNEDKSLGTVFVTGANGYLGSWIVYYLLQNKFNVKASVRNLRDKESYQHLLDFDSVKKHPGRLQIVEGKLEDRELWVEHLQGCYAVIHSASPNPYLPVKRDLEIIYPAVEGTLAILHAAQANCIQYFVLTGSLSNVRGTQYRKFYNEDVWADIDGLSAYEQSKLLSERCAEFFNKENGSFTQLTTLLPGTMFGPT
jgi:dihydroflavonol-4-reductase